MRPVIEGNYTCVYTAAAVNCDREFSSRTAREGMFSSPGYPNPHPGDITCRYRFHGHGRERVQVIFDDVDLNTPQATVHTKTKLVFSDFSSAFLPHDVYVRVKVTQREGHTE